jgi:UDPglucose 6-dehydrogenase
MTKTSVGIVGMGWVGKAMHDLFPDAYCYDIAMPETSMENINKCDVAFICVPSPCPDKKRLDTSIVESIIKDCTCDLIVVRSTVNPGDCDRWSLKYKRNIVMQPEYLGETPQHPLLDTKKTPFIIMGGSPTNTRKLINLYTSVYNANVSIRQVTARQAEIIKLSENRAIVYKVAQCQELYDACEANAEDYYVIRDAVYGDDPRFNLWWTFIYPEKRGFNSKCVPKDIYAWCAWAESAGFKPELTLKLLEVNDAYINNNPE